MHETVDFIVSDDEMDTLYFYMKYIRGVALLYTEIYDAFEFELHSIITHSKRVSNYSNG